MNIDIKDLPLIQIPNRNGSFMIMDGAKISEMSMTI